MGCWLRHVKCNGDCCRCCYFVGCQREGKGCVNRRRWKRFEMFKNHKMKLFLNSLFTLWLLFEFWNEFHTFVCSWLLQAVGVGVGVSSRQQAMVNSIKQQLSIDHIFLFIWLGNLFSPILNNIFHFNQFHLISQNIYLLLIWLFFIILYEIRFFWHHFAYNRLPNPPPQCKI